MILLCYLIVSLLLLLALLAAGGRRSIRNIAGTFYGLQIVLALWIVTAAAGHTDCTFFRFDPLGMLFFSLMTLLAPAVFYQSNHYLCEESLRDYKIYTASFLLLCLALTGVYFSDNLAVTWIFVEATTLSTAALIYHRRHRKNLEATWKYLFVCSVGVAIAYLGILFLSTLATQNGDLSYANLKNLISTGNPLYLQLAFVFILIGYSCKMETFPLFTVGVDANYAAPTPASAFISTALVNGGFVAFFRVYKLFENSPVAVWTGKVLLITGLCSLLVAAVYLRRTGNAKRLLAYSTVENLGIVLIGLGIGGIGRFAAIFHLVAHTFIKAGLFLQLAQIGKHYGTYRIARIGSYFQISKLGGSAILLGIIALLALPPSALFVSEFIILKQLILERHWIILAVFVLLVCLVLYSLCTFFLKICYKKIETKPLQYEPTYHTVTWIQLTLIAVALLLGAWQPQFLIDLIYNVIA